MNAVEIEEAVSELAGEPFDRDEFAFQFLTAFGMKDTTVRRLRTGSSNSSDVPGGVLQRSNIHIAISPAGQVGETLAALRASPKTVASKAKFILTTDGGTLEAEDLASGEAMACEYADLPLHFGFFLPLGGISTVTEIKNNPIDIKATGRLNKLYVELLKDNADWGAKEKRPALNQFMARLIFCFFAEDTGIFLGDGLFTSTVARMSAPGHGSGEERWGNTHEVLAELFRSMATDTRHNGQLDSRHRRNAGIKSWADAFPYVNGGLFSGSVECPKFSRIARSYLLRAGELSWKEINPDIFGSMIQAVADDDERGELGMHYTSVPNILKVLNPLFLDDLREQLEAASDNIRKLRNLRKRIAGIRVFDPACGSGNFLVIAYLKMREIEHEVVQRTGDDPRSLIRLTNFYGIEIKSFAVEIARLSLLIAEFQADCRYISQHEARAMVLPLHRTGQIHVGNALRINWQTICPVVSSEVVEHDLAGPTGRLSLDSDGTAGEVFLCGNPPYKGSQDQTPEQKADVREAFDDPTASTGTADYVLGWFAKACNFIRSSEGAFAFVTTNSVHQGRQVARFWPKLLKDDLEVCFAEPSFRWSNLAANKAVVTVSIIGIARNGLRPKVIFDAGLAKRATVIGPYLVPDQLTIVEERRRVLSEVAPMSFGSMPNDGGHLLLSSEERETAQASGVPEAWVRRFLGTNELTKGLLRYCLWLTDAPREEWAAVPFVKQRVCAVLRNRVKSSRDATRSLARVPHRFGEIRQTGRELVIAVGGVSSERREYLPVDCFERGSIISNLAFGLFDVPLWYLAIIASRLHLVWVATVCGKLETRYRYSNTLGWNTFPLPRLTAAQKDELTARAQGILLAREACFPANITELYESDDMPDDLRAAHAANDDTLERIYIGRRFRNDTERLEKLFQLYGTMIAAEAKTKKAKPAS
ncbi:MULTISPECIES: class I SAM-dependent DNA methyltransferase [Sphingomonas]|uniref:class I SAM-dependent DNA methyltransferase n=1 Tax=Sphingomonas TaxID=13687 RepID=UPI000DEF68B6|nr:MULTISPECIES: DNA methyltransferase [Sphingomonas]